MVRTSSLLLRLTVVFACLVVGATEAWAKPLWNVVTDAKTNVVRGLEYEFVAAGILHRFDLSIVPGSTEMTRASYSLRKRVRFGGRPLEMKSIAFILENGKHMVLSSHSKSTASLRKYTACNQSYEGTTFSKGLMGRWTRLLAKLGKRPAVRSPAGIAALQADPSFLRLQTEVRRQVARLRPAGKAAWQAFSFATCEKPTAVTAALKASGQIKGLDLDDADLEQHDESRNVINAMYMYDYAEHAASRARAGHPHVYELDAMGQAGPFSTIKMVMKRRGAKTLKLSTATEAYAAQTTAYFVEMKIPLVSWFTTIGFEHYIGTKDGRRTLIATLTTMPGNAPLLSWPLDRR